MLSVLPLLKPPTRRFITTSEAISEAISGTSSNITSNTTIRPLEEADKNAWRDLWLGYNEFYRRSIPREVTRTIFSRFMDDSIPMFAAVAVNQGDDKILGFVHWLPHMSTSSIEEVVYVQDLFVHPDSRARDIGGALLDFALVGAEKLQASSVYWHTQHFNHRAQLLYTKVADRTDFVVYRKTF